MNGRDEDRLHIRSVDQIGQAVRAARKDQGLTQREFADIVGVGVRFLSELERGKRTAEVGLVLEVAAGAGYDVILQRRGWTRPGGGSDDGTREDD
jgi:y4mF family transcriptional regulator